jgi:hypothetical protein
MAQQSPRQSFGEASKSNEQQVFNSDLCEALLSANIPLTKLNNSNLKTFLEKYCQKNILDESTLRKSYVIGIYTRVINNIRQQIQNHYVYFVVDETTDSRGRYIANLLVGRLSEGGPSKSYLIACKQLEKTNHVTILRFVNESLMNFFRPEVVPTEKILLMLSDAASYMVKAGHQLKLLYPNLIHYTCLAHRLNRVAEEIRNHFPNVNTLISSVKKIFLKAPLRVQRYKEKMPNIPLPPEPVLTRWGTWLNATVFYAEHFQPIKELILEFEQNHNSSIIKCQSILKTTTLQSELAFIKANYDFVSKTITNLEVECLPLHESIKIITNFEEKICKVPGKIGQKVKQNFFEVIEKNTGYHSLQKANRILMGDFEDNNLELSPQVISALKYAPITSADVERSFSSYKYLLSDRRHNYLIENLEKHLIVNYYNNKNM